MVGSGSNDGLMVWWGGGLSMEGVLWNAGETEYGRMVELEHMIGVTE